MRRLPESYFPDTVNIQSAGMPSANIHHIKKVRKTGCQRLGNEQIRVSKETVARTPALRLRLLQSYAPAASLQSANVFP